MMNLKEYMLICMAEECDEVGQRCMKALRFSTTEIEPGHTMTNAERIIGELHDLIAVATLLARDGVLPDEIMPSEAIIQAKAARIEKFMAISRDQGIIA